MNDTPKKSGWLHSLQARLIILLAITGTILAILNNLRDIKDALNNLITKNNPEIEVLDKENTKNEPLEPSVPRDTIIIKSISIDQNISLIGIWPNVNGDNEMDTDGDDLVIPQFRSTISYRPDKIELTVYFSCAETVGDRTKFEGEVTKTIYESEPNQEIESLVVHNPSVNFRGRTKGKNHKFNNFPRTNGTYWKSLQFRVDGPGKDNNIVGVRGRISFKAKVKEKIAI